jgi:hypothetical protein
MGMAGSRLPGSPSVQSLVPAEPFASGWAARAKSPYDSSTGLSTDSPGRLWKSRSARGKSLRALDMQPTKEHPRCWRAGRRASTASRSNEKLAAGLPSAPGSLPLMPMLRGRGRKRAGGPADPCDREGRSGGREGPASPQSRSLRFEVASVKGESCPLVLGWLSVQRPRLQARRARPRPQPSTPTTDCGVQGATEASVGRTVRGHPCHRPIDLG